MSETNQPPADEIISRVCAYYEKFNGGMINRVVMTAAIQAELVGTNVLARHIPSSPADEWLEEIAEKCSFQICMGKASADQHTRPIVSGLILSVLNQAVAYWRGMIITAGWLPKKEAPYDFLMGQNNTIETLQEAVAKLTKERNEFKQTLAAFEAGIKAEFNDGKSVMSDDTVDNFAEFIRHHKEVETERDQLLRDKEALQKVARELVKVAHESLGTHGDKCESSLCPMIANANKALLDYTSLPESIRGKDKE